MFSRIGRRTLINHVESAGKRGPRSLVTVLTGWYACTVFILVVIAASAFYLGLERALDVGNAELLRERIQVLRKLLRQGEAKRAELKWEVESEWEGLEEPKIYLRVLDERHNVLLESPGMDKLVPVEAFPAVVNLEMPGRSFRAAGPAGREFLASEVTARFGDTERWVIHAALDLTAEEALLGRQRYWLAMMLAAAALLSFVVGRQIAWRGIRPLRRVSEATRRIRSTTLKDRVPVAGLPSELASLADDFNSMLHRLEDSFARLSHFAGDTAHELRTPINNLQGEMELVLTRPRSPGEYRDVLAACLEECSNLTRILDRLQFIAMAERSDVQIGRERLNVAAELRTIVEFYEPVATEQGITLRNDCSGELWIEADRTLFRRSIVNLISNSVANTPAGGTISVAASQQGPATRIEVSDTGIGIPAEHLPHVFDRFYRVDPTRLNGMGCGLNIVKTIMDLHGGSAGISSEPGRGTRVTLTFPQVAHS